MDALKSAMSEAFWPIFLAVPAWVLLRCLVALVHAMYAHNDAVWMKLRPTLRFLHSWWALLFLWGGIIAYDLLTPHPSADHFATGTDLTPATNLAEARKDVAEAESSVAGHDVEEESPKDWQSISENKQELSAIARNVVMGGKLDQKIHDHFWILIPPSLRSTPERVQTIKASFIDTLNFQKEFWNSILLSAESHKVMKTKAFDDMYAGIKKVNAEEAERCDGMLEASAKGVPYQYKEGQEAIVLNVAFAQKVLTTLDASSNQLDNLLNPAWKM